MNPPSSLRPRRGFTLIELLVVIAIIAILAGMLLPAVAAAQTKAKRTKAKTDISNLAAAVSAYQAAYGRLPSSQATRNAVSKDYPDFTYGTANGSTQVQDSKGGGVIAVVKNGNGGSPWQVSNAELIAILTDSTLSDVKLTTAPAYALVKDTDGKAINSGSSLNPQHNTFLTIKTTKGFAPNGVSESDGVYRDPWGRPYIISLDLDYDNRVLDPFPKTVNGRLFPASDVDNARTINAGVIVWSLGPDGKVDFNQPADAKGTANADNLYSWR